jgi:hypothetical protein
MWWSADGAEKHYHGIPAKQQHMGHKSRHMMSNSTLSSSMCKQTCVSNQLQLPEQHHGWLQDFLAGPQQVRMLLTVVTHYERLCSSLTPFFCL